MRAVSVLICCCLCVLVTPRGGMRTLMAQAAPIDDCSCAGALDRMAAKVAANHAGYATAAEGEAAAAYARHLSGARQDARGAAAGDCLVILHRYLRFFRDGHLFAGSNPRFDEETAKTLRESAERIERNEAAMRRDLDSGRALDPIEGIWYAKDGSRFAIVPDRREGRRDFVAITLASPVAGWLPGHVKAEFRAHPDRTYDVMLNADDHSPRYPSVYLRGEIGGAAIRRGVLLHMPPTTWGKSYPLTESERAGVDPVDPRRPTARAMSDGTVVFAVPSHLPEYEPVLTALVAEFADRLRAAGTLIVDLRGNEGGSSGMTGALMPYIGSADRRTPRYGSDTGSVIRSSPDNIAYVERVLSEGWLPRDLADRMRAAPGALVHIPAPPQAALPASTWITGPRRVAILVDGGVVSAAEAAVLSAMQSTRVTVFGEPTGGVIDFQNVRLVGGISCPAQGIYLGYPTLGRAGAASHPINPTGIVPDVPIGRDVADPIAAIIAHYRTLR